jgi:hypothetical protein
LLQQHLTQSRKRIYRNPAGTRVRRHCQRAAGRSLWQLLRNETFVTAGAASVADGFHWAAAFLTIEKRRQGQLSAQGDYSPLFFLAQPGHSPRLRIALKARTREASRHPPAHTHAPCNCNTLFNNLKPANVFDLSSLIWATACPQKPHTHWSIKTKIQANAALPSPQYTLHMHSLRKRFCVIFAITFITTKELRHESIGTVDFQCSGGIVSWATNKRNQFIEGLQNYGLKIKRKDFLAMQKCERIVEYFLAPHRG